MKKEFSFEPKDFAVNKVHAYLLSAVIPRPIGFVSTIDKDGNVNLSPFSFFNCFGANPPTLVFSPARRVRGNTVKHTLENVKEVAEAVVGIVNYNTVEQMSISSTEYPKGVNEFIKSGLTEYASDIVKPPRIVECPVNFECKVSNIIETGNEGGAGNLVVCTVVKMHIDEKVLDENRHIDPVLLDPVSRLGGSLYSRLTKESIFEIQKPLSTPGIGYDNLPVWIKNSDSLTGNDLGKLANCERLPDLIDPNSISDSKLTELLNKMHQELQENRIESAWKMVSR